MDTTTDTAPSAPAEFRLLDLDGFLTKFAALGKRAVKLGVAPPTYTVAATLIEQQYRGAGGGTSYAETIPQGAQPTGQARTVTVVTVEGLAPQLPGGWTLAAVLSEVGGLTLVSTVPGQTVDERFRTADPSACEHCNIAIRRRQSFVVRDADGQEKQVGRQCLRDFLGHTSPEQVARWCEYAADFGSGERDNETDPFGGRAERMVARDDFLAAVAASIRQNGWLSRSASRGTSTASEAWDAFFPYSPQGRADADAFMASITDLDRKLAAETVAWLQGLETRTGLDDYLWNLRVAGSTAALASRQSGLVASAVTAMQREQGREIERRASAKRNAASEFVGTVGKREAFGLATVIAVRSLPSDWGVTTLLKFQTTDGALLAWFASGEHEFAIGAEVTITATVKRHEERDGSKQTLITRAKVLTAER